MIYCYYVVMIKEAVDLDELLLNLEAIAKPVNTIFKTPYWTTIGGVGVFLHLAYAFGIDEATKLMQAKGRTTYDIDILIKEESVKSVIETELLKTFKGVNFDKSLSIRDKYVFKGRTDLGEQIHFDIYLPHKSDEFTGVLEFDNNYVDKKVFEDSISVNIDGVKLYIPNLIHLLELKLMVRTAKSPIPRKKDIVDIGFLVDAAEKEGINLKRVYSYQSDVISAIEGYTGKQIR